MIIDYNPSNLNKKDVSEKEEKVRLLIKNDKDDILVANYGGAYLLPGGKMRPVGEFHGHVLDLVAVGCAHHEHIVYHLGSDAVGNLADSVRAGNRHDLASQFESLLAGAPGHVAET